jgi:hypothetical protein
MNFEANQIQSTDQVGGSEDVSVLMMVTEPSKTSYLDVARSCTAQPGNWMTGAG